MLRVLKQETDKIIIVHGMIIAVNGTGNRFRKMGYWDGGSIV